MRIAYVGSPELFLRGASGIHVMKMCQAIAKLGHSVESLYVGIKRVLEDRVLAERLATQASNDAKKYTWKERTKKIINQL